MDLEETEEHHMKSYHLLNLLPQLSKLKIQTVQQFDFFKSSSKSTSDLSKLSIKEAVS